MFVYLCNDTPESIFTAIYNIYQDRHNLPDTRLLLEWEPLLLAEYITVQDDVEKATKVIRTIHKQFGENDVHHIFMALSAPSNDKAEAVYRTITHGLRDKVKPGHLFDNLTDRYILLTSKLGLNASRECQHLKGFLRFKELENGILFSLITPKNNILPELMEHFSNRFPSENFMILDEGRKLFGIHKTRESWFMVTADYVDELKEMMRVSMTEKYYSELFKHFCKSIAIKERRSEELQRNMLPLRFRTNMTEFM